MRSAIAIVVGVLLAFSVVSLGEWLGHLLYPLPEGVDPTDVEAIKRLVPQLPPGAFVAVLAAWGLGAFLGAAAGAHLAYRNRTMHGLIVGGVVLACAIWMLVKIPGPAWFNVAALVLIPLLAYLGTLAGTQPLPGDLEGWIVKENPDYSRTE